MRLSLIAAASSAVLLSACASVGANAPDPKTAARLAPAAFEHAAPTEAAAQPDPLWWRALGDPLLDRLVDQAMTSNREIGAAAADLRQARALAKLAGSQGLPFGGLSVAGGRAQPEQTGVAQDFRAAGAEVSWELDVFGRIRAGTRAARADALSLLEARRGVMAAVAAQTAATYVDLRGTQDRLAAAQANLDAQRETLRLTETLFRGGRSNQLEVTRTNAALQTIEASLPRLEAQIEADVAALDVLTGGLDPQAKAALRGKGALPAPPAQIAAGSPQDLLRRRPDIRRGEARVEAAAARVAATRVDWWPRISLAGSASLWGGSWGALDDDQALSFTLGPRIDWPALDVRRNALRTEAARAGAEAEYLRFEQTVLSALRDSETALSNLAAARRTAARAELAARSARQAANLSRLRYREGADPFLNVLDAERTLAAADDELAVARTELARAYIALGLALGAGWSDDEGGATKLASAR